MWFTECKDSKSGPYWGDSVIGRVDPSTGTIKEYPLPDNDLEPYGIAAGPDGALWMTEFAGYNVDRVALKTSSAIVRGAKRRQ